MLYEKLICFRLSAHYFLLHFLPLYACFEPSAVKHSRKVMNDIRSYLLYEWDSRLLRARARV